MSLHLHLVQKTGTQSFSLTILVALFIWWSGELLTGIWTGVDGISFNAHKICIEYIETPGVYNSLNLKLICSYTNKRAQTLEISDNYLIFIFSQLGLLHLLVASGTHLLILKSGCNLLIKTITNSMAPVFILLFIFVLASNFNTPVTRSFVQVLISFLVLKHSLALSQVNVTFLSSFIFLTFFPAAFLTLSFWLSLSASLFIGLFGRYPIRLSLVFYLGLLPFIMNFTVPSVASVLINLVITPVLAPLLILNSLFYSVVKFYRPVGEWIFVMIEVVLRSFVLTNFDKPSSFFRLPSELKFIYGFLILALALYFQYLRSRKLCAEIKI